MEVGDVPYYKWVLRVSLPSVGGIIRQEIKRPQLSTAGILSSQYATSDQIDDTLREMQELTDQQNRLAIQEGEVRHTALFPNVLTDPTPADIAFTTKRGVHTSKAVRKRGKAGLSDQPEPSDISPG